MSTSDAFYPRKNSKDSVERVGSLNSVWMMVPALVNVRKKFCLQCETVYVLTFFLLTSNLDVLSVR